MRVLGIDIGIKNLAYCVVEKHGKDYTIPEPLDIHWNIINIVREHVDCVVDGCENDIIRCTNINNKMHYFCAKHGRTEYKKLCEKYPVNKYLLEKTEKCSFNKSCKAKASCKLNGTFLCPKHDIMITRQLAKERVYREYKNLIKSKYTIDDLKERLMNALDAHKELFLTVDHVRIEFQPMFVDNKIKLIMDALASWFYIRGIIDKKQNKSHIKTIKFSSSGNKLRISENDQLIKEKIDNSSNRYSATKQMGIEETRIILINQPKCLEHLERFKKKDDVCDAYLHGIYGIQENIRKAIREKRPIHKPKKTEILQRKWAVISAKIQNSKKRWRQIYYN